MLTVVVKSLQAWVTVTLSRWDRSYNLSPKRGRLVTFFIISFSKLCFLNCPHLFIHMIKSNWSLKREREQFNGLVFLSQAVANQRWPLQSLV